MLVDTNTVRSINGQKYLKKKFSGHVIIKEQTLMTSLYHNQATQQSTETNFTHSGASLSVCTRVHTHTHSFSSYITLRVRDCQAFGEA